MSVQHAILGFLSWRELTGYDLKKLFEASSFLPWAGNNNQVYRGLVELHQGGLVELEVIQQESLPPRKVYRLTAAGREALRTWVGGQPELPRWRSELLVQLAWADLLTADELDALLARYDEELHVELLMARERARRRAVDPARTPREALLWTALHAHEAALLEAELAWARSLRQDLRVRGMGPGGAR